MRRWVVITDCNHPSTHIERAVFESAGLGLQQASCRTEDDVIAAGQGAIALLTQYAPVTARVLDALPECRAVGRYGVGFDTIDVAAAEKRHVRLVRVPDYCVDEVSDHAIALLLALTRRIVQLDRSVHAGRWDFRAAGPIRRTNTLCLGIIGMGVLGRATSRKAQALGFTVIGHDPMPVHNVGVPMVRLDELLERSDAVTLHVPLTEDTRHLIDARRIGQMRDGALLINTSRGGVVDHDALRRALQRGKLGGAALDVLEDEPISPDDPLLDLPNVIITPHAGFYSEESLDELKRRVAEGLVQAIANAPTV